MMYARRLTLTLFVCVSVLCLAVRAFGADEMSAYLDRSYYTSEAEAVVVCTVALPEEVLGGSVLTVKDAKGSVLGRNATVSPETRLVLKVAALPVGRHNLKLELRKDADGAVSTSDLILVKKAPKPGSEVKVDKINRILLRDGKPFFPLGLIMGGVVPIERDIEDFEAVEKLGINTVIQWVSRRPPEESKDYQEMAAKYNLLLIQRIAGYYTRGVDLDNPESFLEGAALEEAKRVFKSGYSNSIKGALIANSKLRKLPLETKSRLFEQFYQKNLPRMTQAIDYAKDYPNLLGYFTFDEPPRSRHFPMHVQGRKLYNHVMERDGYHPTFLLYSSHIPEGDEYIDWCDLLGVDPYWQPGGWSSGIKGTVNWVSMCTARNEIISEAARKVTWSVPMAEYYSGCHKRPLTPEEQYCQTYLALIHGTKGLIYFRYRMNHASSWEALGNVVEQMKLLGPIALSPDIPQDIKYNAKPFNPMSEDPATYPDVQVSLMRNPAGGHVLLAANSRPYPVDVTYKLSCLPDGGEVGRLFAEDSYRVSKRSFTDSFKAYGTRAYTLRAQPLAADASVSINVKAFGHPDAADREVGIPDEGATGKKNILRNPGFEEATVPGWPDYYLPGETHHLIGTKQAEWSQDTSDPYEGKYCMRLSNKHRAGSYNQVLAYCGPKPKEPTKYVLSVYMKADKDGISATLGGGAWASKPVKLTTSWKRYYTVGTVPVGGKRYNHILIRTGREPCTIWVDAVQVEKGEQPTAFEP